LNYLYRQGLWLPDGAQVLTDGIYCRPDFYYEPDIHLFCDGTPHDKPETQEMDKKRREAIRNCGGRCLYGITGSGLRILLQRDWIYLKK